MEDLRGLTSRIIAARIGRVAIAMSQIAPVRVLVQVIRFGNTTRVDCTELLGKHHVIVRISAAF